MAKTEYGPDINLEELRSQLAGRLALLVIGTGGLLACLALPRQPFPSTVFSLLVVLLGLGISVQALVNAHPALAHHLLIWGLTAGLLAAMWLFYDPWLPFLGVMLAFAGTMLMSGGGLATTGAIAALAAWLTHGGARAYPLPGLLTTLTLGVALAWLVVRTLYTALGWAWTMQQRSDHLLEVSRDHQGELSRALKSLGLTNTILLRTQRELVTARRQAEEARVMKEQFAANVSHELRTPLNIILGFSEVMYLSPEVYGDLEWPPALREDVYQVYSSSRHLLGMIDDVLDLSRFEMVGFTLNKEPTPLAPLLRDTVGIITDLFRDRSIRLEVELAPDLPTMDIDRTRIRQVLLNLLNNAARFTEEGEVRLEAGQKDGEVIVSISDTGPGIPVDELPHLFQEFYQVDSSLRRRHGGAGLGLAISKHFVDAHDGRIWVESQEGVGSTFSFTLPIPGQHVSLSRLQATDPVASSYSEARQPVLVVDPDSGVADLVDRHVEEYDVVWVEDVDHLHEEVMLHHPRAVVCNVPPGEKQSYDGAVSAPVPLIECSLPSQTWLANDLAVAACLTKPITAQQLLREIGRLGSVHDVLVIDDDWGFCQLVARMLEAAGSAFELRRANDGSEGLLALKARRPDLVLLDLIMPGVDGFQVLDEMRRDPELADVPVVVLTATSYVEDAMRQLSGQMLIRRADGLGPVEVLRCLRAVIGVLEPRYDERSAPDEATVMRET
jgi:signal transduction histidine kinase/CheY-like chemotaxis protein